MTKKIKIKIKSLSKIVTSENLYVLKFCINSTLVHYGNIGSRGSHNFGSHRVELKKSNYH